MYVDGHAHGCIYVCNGLLNERLSGNRPFEAFIMCILFYVFSRRLRLRLRLRLCKALSLSVAKPLDSAPILSADDLFENFRRIRATLTGKASRWSIFRHLQWSISKSTNGPELGFELILTNMPDST